MTKASAADQGRKREEGEIKFPRRRTACWYKQPVEKPQRAQNQEKGNAENLCRPPHKRRAVIPQAETNDVTHAEKPHFVGGRSIEAMGR